MNIISNRELNRIASYFNEGSMTYTYEADIKNAKFIGEPKDTLSGKEVGTDNQRTGTPNCIDLGFKVKAQLQFNEESEFNNQNDTDLSALFKENYNQNNDQIDPNNAKLNFTYTVDVDVMLNYLSNIGVSDLELETEGVYYTHGEIDYSELTDLLITNIEFSKNLRDLFNDFVSDNEIKDAIISDFNLNDEFAKRVNHAIEEGDSIVTFYDHEKEIPADI